MRNVATMHALCVSALAGTGIALSCAGCAKHLAPTVVAYDDEALEIINAKLGSVAANASDAFYWWNYGIDHTGYYSFTLPAGEARWMVEKAAANHNTSARKTKGPPSQFDFINHGPVPRPTRWRTDYWNVASIQNGLVFEIRYAFICADLDTGRVYRASWSE